MRYDSLPPEALARRLACESLVVLERVTSTQDLLHQMAEDGAPSWSIVLADEQVRGRGRMNREWFSGRGKGVLMSFLLRPSSHPATSVTSLRVGLAVLDTLRAIDIDAKLKWPNDILVRNRKMAGILCESRWRRDRLQWIVVGIGINVHGPVPAAMKDRAIAIDELVPDVSRLGIMENLLPRLRSMPEGETLSDEEVDCLQRHDWLVNRQLAAPVAGRACGVAEDGALRIVTDGGTVSVVGGEVVIA